MNQEQLAKKTVLQLRQVAKANGVTLGAGVSKENIVNKIIAAMESKGGMDNIVDPTAEAKKDSAEQDAAQSDEKKPAQGMMQPVQMHLPQEKSPAAQAPQTAGRTNPVQQAAPAQSAQQPQFRAAWHNPAPRPTVRPQYPQQTRQPVQNQPQQRGYQDSGRTVPQRQTVTAPHRFGPDAEAVRSDDYRSRRTPYDNQDRAFSRGTTNADFPQENVMPTVSELIDSGDCVDICGFLEMEPDGTGFIRTGFSVTSTGDDAFVSAVQVSRYGMKTGDLVLGKASSQRVSGKVHPLLFITEINGNKAEEKTQREDFDQLTASYPERNVRMDSGEENAELISRMNPLGFGARSIILIPEGSDYSEFLGDIALNVNRCNPDVSIVYLMINGRAEDASAFSKKPGFTVFCASFDMGEQEQIHMAQLALEHAKRLAESQRDVLMLVDDFDSLLALGEKGTHKAKEIFSAARRIAEGGSLTVISTMEMKDSGECRAFRKAANHWLTIGSDSEATENSRHRSPRV